MSQGTSERNSEAASPYLLQHLENISSPVPDFAATLSTRDEDHLENMSYIRARLPEVPESNQPILTRSERTRQPYLTEREFQNFTSESRRRMQRTLEARRHTPRASTGSQQEAAGTSYANRAPQQQSLYDWAPETGEESDEWDTRPYRFDVLNRSREHLPLQEQTHIRTIQRSIDAQRAARSRPRREPRDEPSGHLAAPHWAESLRNHSSSPRSEQSLSATAALLQSVERHRRYNARARQTMQGFILDRDRLNHEASTREVISSRLHRSENTRGTSPYSHYLAHSPSSSRDLRAAYRQMFLDNPSLTRLKHMMKYLSDLRHCDSAEDCDDLAAGLDFDTFSETAKPYPNPDFIMDVTVLQLPQYSSWLTPGAVFCGHQHSPQEPPTLMLNRDRESIRRHINTYQNSSARWNFEDEMPASLRTLADAERYVNSLSTHHLPPSIATAQASARPLLLDNWPVRVEIHAVDLQEMTLCGTMSASHIPDKLSPSSPDHKPGGKSMRSFFEGEIIDFQKHSLETENFRSDGLETDVTYWRQIGPFREIAKNLDKDWRNGEGLEDDEDEMARCLASREWIDNVLMQDWVLMRWKERCFVDESDSAWGLTISGFYYIAMKRDTGRIEGLYFDPGSQPYQRLTMLPEGTKEGASHSIRKEWPSFEFR